MCLIDQLFVQHVKKKRKKKESPTKIHQKTNIPLKLFSNLKIITYIFFFFALNQEWVYTELAGWAHQNHNKFMITCLILWHYLNFKAIQCFKSTSVKRHLWVAPYIPRDKKLSVNKGGGGIFHCIKSDCIRGSRIWRWSDRATERQTVIPFENSQAKGDGHQNHQKWILLQSTRKHSCALGSIKTFPKYAWDTEI